MSTCRSLHEFHNSLPILNIADSAVVRPDPKIPPLLIPSEVTLVVLKIIPLNIVPKHGRKLRNLHSRAHFHHQSLQHRGLAGVVSADDQVGTTQTLEPDVPKGSEVLEFEELDHEPRLAEGGCGVKDRKMRQLGKRRDELPMPEIQQMEKLAVNRPVPELSVTADPVVHRIKHERVKTALGGPYMGVICSNCGSDKVIRAGACGCCTQCGTSQGCS